MLQLGRVDRENHLHATAQVAVHPVGGSDVDLRVAAVTKVEDATVLQEAVDDGDDPHVFAQPLDAGPQSADPAADEVDLYARLTGPIDCLNDGRFQEAIDLGDDPPA